MITDDQYGEAFAQLQQLGHAIHRLDLLGMLARIDVAASRGPVFDPQLYILHGASLEPIRQLANAALVLQIQVHRLAREEGMR